MSIPCFSGCLLLALACGSSPASTSVTLRPGVSSSSVTNGDAFVTTGPTNDLSGNNYGGAGVLGVAALGSPTGTFASVLRFDVSPAKTAFDAAYHAGGWSVEAVTLRLSTTAANNRIFNSSVPGLVAVQWIAADSWEEGTGNPRMPFTSGITWDGFASLLNDAESMGTLQVVNVGAGVTGDYPLTPSSGMKTDISLGGSVGFALTPADSSVAVLFNSRNFGTASRNPALILTAGPILPAITNLSRPDPQGHFVLSFTCTAEFDVVIESSTDLIAWVGAGSVTTVTGANTVALDAEPSSQNRFWRLRRILP